LRDRSLLGLPEGLAVEPPRIEVRARVTDDRQEGVVRLEDAAARVAEDDPELLPSKKRRRRRSLRRSASSERRRSAAARSASTRARIWPRTTKKTMKAKTTSSAPT
jgi:hypothetical protein